MNKRNLWITISSIAAAVICIVTVTLVLVLSGKKATPPETPPQTSTEDVSPTRTLTESQKQFLRDMSNVSNPAEQEVEDIELPVGFEYATITDVFVNSADYLVVKALISGESRSVFFEKGETGLVQEMIVADTVDSGEISVSEICGHYAVLKDGSFRTAVYNLETAECVYPFSSSRYLSISVEGDYLFCMSFDMASATDTIIYYTYDIYDMQNLTFEPIYSIGYGSIATEDMILFAQIEGDYLFVNTINGCKLLDLNSIDGENITTVKTFETIFTKKPATAVEGQYKFILNGEKFDYDNEAFKPQEEMIIIYKEISLLLGDKMLVTTYGKNSIESYEILDLATGVTTAYGETGYTYTAKIVSGTNYIQIQKTNLNKTESKYIYLNQGMNELVSYNAIYGEVVQVLNDKLVVAKPYQTVLIDMFGDVTKTDKATHFKGVFHDGVVPAYGPYIDGESEMYCIVDKNFSLVSDKYFMRITPFHNKQALGYYPSNAEWTYGLVSTTAETIDIPNLATDYVDLCFSVNNIYITTDDNINFKLFDYTQTLIVTSTSFTKLETDIGIFIVSAEGELFQTVSTEIQPCNYFVPEVIPEGADPTSLAIAEPVYQFQAFAVAVSNSTNMSGTSSTVYEDLPSQYSNTIIGIFTRVEYWNFTHYVATNYSANNGYRINSFTYTYTTKNTANKTKTVQPNASTFTQDVILETGQMVYSYSWGGSSPIWNYVNSEKVESCSVSFSTAAMSYSIGYVSNGGTINDNVWSYTYGNYKTLPANVTKTGYDFAGWYDNSSCTGSRIYEISNTSTGNKTFYAKWTAKTYNITYDLNGKQSIWHGNTLTGTYTFGNTTPLASIINVDATDKANNNFLGWYTSKTGGTKVERITSTDYGAKTFYAHWQQKNTFNTALYMSPNDNTYCSLYGNPTPTSTGQTLHMFNISSYNATGTNGVLLTPLTTTNGLGGTLTGASKVCANGSTSAYIPSYDGYEFLGWWCGNDQITDASGTILASRKDTSGNWNYGVAGKNLLLIARYKARQFNTIHRQIDDIGSLDGTTIKLVRPASETATTDHTSVFTRYSMYYAKSLLPTGYTSIFQNEFMTLELRTYGDGGNTVSDCTRIYKFKVAEDDLVTEGTFKSFSINSSTELSCNNTGLYTGIHIEIGGDTTINGVVYTKFMVYLFGTNPLYNGKVKSVGVFARFKDVKTITLDANGGTISASASGDWIGSGATATKRVVVENGVYSLGDLPTSTYIKKAGYTLENWSAVTTGTNKEIKLVDGVSYGNVYALSTGDENTSNDSCKFKVQKFKDGEYLPNSDQTTKETGIFSLTFTKDSGFDALRFGVNGNKKDLCWIIDVSHLSNGSVYTITFNIVSMGLNHVVMDYVAITDGGLASIGNKTTASWTANTYTVQYNGNDATGGSTASSSHKYDTAKNLTANGYTKTGYRFAGWSTTSNGAVKYSNKQLVKNLTTAKNGIVTLYAQWTANTYRVALNNQGATTAGTTGYCYKYEIGTYYTNSNCTTTLSSITKPTKAGYTFGGYYTGTNGTGTQYVNANGAFVNAIYNNVASNVTLYAKWTATTYRISVYPGEHGAYPISPQIAEYTIESKPTSIANPVVSTGWEFDYWLITTVVGVSSYSVNDEFDWPESAGAYGDISITAQYARVTGTIKFISNGGSAVASITGDYDTSVDYNIRTRSVTRRGYSFVGWYANSGLTQAVTWKYPAGVDTYYAKWTPYQYRINYVLDGGVGGSSRPTSFTFNGAPTDPTTTITISDPTKNNYDFAGWLLSYANVSNIGVGTGFEFESDEYASSLTLTATWVGKSYNLTLDANRGAGYDSVTTTQSIIFNETEKIECNPYEEFNKDGYNFVGWKDAQNRSYSNGADFTMSTAGATLYAQWIAKTDTPYIVEIYQQNVARDGYEYRYSNTYTGTTDTTVSVPAILITGFNYNAEIEGSVSSGNIAGDGSLVLKAYFNRNTYTVEYNVGEGVTDDTPTGTTSSSTFVYGIENTFSSNGFALVGHEFSKWMIGSERYDAGSSTSINFTTANGATITATAIWTPITYSFEFDAGDADDPSSISAQYGESITLPMVSMTGYSLRNWKIAGTIVNANDMDGDGTSSNTVIVKSFVSPTDYSSSNTILLQAVMEPNIYTITLDPCGGKFEAETSDSYSIRYNTNYEYIFSAIADPMEYETYPTPIADIGRLGWGFDGWYLSQEEGNGFGTALNLTNVFQTPNDVTLYAKWTQKTYTVAFDLDTTILGKNTKHDPSINVADPTAITNLVVNAELALPMPIVYGYEFLNWQYNTKTYSSGTKTFDNMLLGMTVVDFNAIENGTTITLSANWQELYAFGVTYMAKLNEADENFVSITKYFNGASFVSADATKGNIYVLKGTQASGEKITSILPIISANDSLGYRYNGYSADGKNYMLAYWDEDNSDNTYQANAQYYPTGLADDIMWTAVYNERVLVTFDSTNTYETGVGSADYQGTISDGLRAFGKGTNYTLELTKGTSIGTELGLRNKGVTFDGIKIKYTTASISGVYAFDNATSLLDNNGWFTGEDGTGDAVLQNTAFSTAQTIHQYWTANVTYVAYGFGYDDSVANELTEMDKALLSNLHLENNGDILNDNETKVAVYLSKANLEATLQWKLEYSYTSENNGSLNIFEIDGVQYRFAGFYKDEAFTEVADSIKTNCTLYAKFVQRCELTLNLPTGDAYYQSGTMQDYFDSLYLRYVQGINEEFGYPTLRFDELGSTISLAVDAGTSLNVNVGSEHNPIYTELLPKGPIRNDNEVFLCWEYDDGTQLSYTDDNSIIKVVTGDINLYTKYSANDQKSIQVYYWHMYTAAESAENPGFVGEYRTTDQLVFSANDLIDGQLDFNRIKQRVIETNDGGESAYSHVEDGITYDSAQLVEKSVIEEESGENYMNKKLYTNATDSSLYVQFELDSTGALEQNYIVFICYQNVV